MFVRLLKLPDAERSGSTCRSHRVAIHAAAPCPAEVKRKMIEWWGPIIHEYYGGSEGNGLTAIGSHEWLAHPGSVGKARWACCTSATMTAAKSARARTGWCTSARLAAVRVPQGPGEDAPRAAPEASDLDARSATSAIWTRTATCTSPTASSYMIISGGVNIYPQEIENVLALHPKVGRRRR